MKTEQEINEQINELANVRKNLKNLGEKYNYLDFGPSMKELDDKLSILNWVLYDEQ